jgi:hypothetical protein
MWVAAVNGVDVVEHHVVDGATRERPFAHTVLLAGMAGDTPANRKVSLWCGHGATLGCGHCTLRGISGRGMSFLGYAEKVPFGPFYPQQVSGVCFAGDAVCKLDHNDHMARGELIEDVIAGVNTACIVYDGNKERQIVPTDIGCHGVSPLISALGYLDYNNAFPVPIAHAGPYGVVKRFWNLIFSRDCPVQLKLSKQARETIEKRAADIINTLNFGRQYTCIRNKRGSWVMENWLHWLETWSVYILRPQNGRPLLAPEVATMWDCLRRGLLYYLRGCLHADQDDIPSSCEEASALLNEGARLAEIHLGRLCTYNLHLLICRLEDQENARGKVCFGHEYWIEMCVQKCKKILHNRSTHFPEITLVKHLLLQEALANLKMSGGVRSFDESVGTAAQPMMASNVDDGDRQGCQLLGSGHVPTAEESSACHTALQQLWTEFHDDLESAGWSQHMLLEGEILVYSHADAGDSSERIHCKQYRRVQKKESFHVRVSYVEDGDRRVEYVASVQFFVKVLPVQGGSPWAVGEMEPLRLAISRLSKIEKVATVSGILWRMDTTRDVRFESYAVMLKDMKGKVVSAKSASQANFVWFIPYGNLSGA